MGQCALNAPTEAELQSRNVDNKNAKDFDKQSQILKFLLLGAGESGKSTLFKQLTHIYGNGFSSDRRKDFVRTIFKNTIGSMKTLVDEATTRGLTQFRGREYDCRLTGLEDSVKFFEDISVDAPVTQEVAARFKELWESPGIQAVYLLKSDYQLPDAVEYLAGRLDDVADPDYCPTYDDILRSRVRTTGVAETSFSIHNNSFRVLDVGGQRSERKKWIHCFEGVTAVIFVVALSEFDEYLYEDGRKNRMEEAMTLFSDICNSRWFQKTPMVLFLNKSDLLAKKIRKTPISVFFEDYRGDDTDFVSSHQHIKMHFLALNKNHDKEVYPHVTCATDSNNVQKVFNSAQSIIVNSSLRIGGLM